VYFPHSLGIFYQALTQYLGFPQYGDEYKIMGLAPYGTSSRLREIRDILKINDAGIFALNLAYFRHHRERIAFS
jgi:carbamoyltransferase